jgi:hypothetical protein
LYRSGNFAVKKPAALRPVNAYTRMRGNEVL